MRTWYEINSKADANETEVLLYDEIGGFGISAAHFIAALQTIPAAHRLVLRIHSPGGSVLDGNAIATALRNHPGGVTTHIDGLAASMATVIAIAGSPVRMAGNGLFMIHNVSGGVSGDSEEMRRMADLCDKIQETIVAQYVAKTGLSRRRVMQMMDAETWMTATEAKAHGFIDEITGDLAMAAKFDLTSFRNAPQIDTTRAVMSEPVIITAEEKSFLQRLAAFFQPAAVVQLDPLAQAEAELITARVALDGITAARDAALAQVATLTTERDAALAQVVTPEALAAKVSAQVTTQLAAAGAAPIARDPSATATDGDISAQLAEIKDPVARRAFFKTHRSAIRAEADAQKTPKAA